tara:strand:- start:92 stop:349 length:258 start_codon:yes stop_codon:yes gene_type:complete
MSLGKQELEDQIAKLTKDIKTLQNAITDFEKKKQEAIAQLNAFQGAVQQCQLFLKEINNEAESETDDLGGLPDAPKEEEKTDDQM